MTQTSEERVENRRRASRELRERHRAWLIGRVCAWPGCDETDDLQFDHIDPTLKTCGNDSVIRLSEPRWRAELPNLQAMCPPHNRLKAALNGEHPRGEQHGCAVLTADQVLEIRRLYSDGGVSQRTLATRFDVSQGAVSHIVTRKSWSHV